MIAGVWKFALAVPAGAYAGYYIREWRREKLREKWAKIRHYIELHPEDFPRYPGTLNDPMSMGTCMGTSICTSLKRFPFPVVTARTKVGDTLAPWIPIRTGW